MKHRVGVALIEDAERLRGMRPGMRRLGFMLCAVAMPCGCASPRWDGRVESWGGMRQVMRDGETEARVNLVDVVARPHAFGVGAVEGLRGEIVIDDGRCWVAQVAVDSDPHGGKTGLSALRVDDNPSSLHATLLAVAYVPTWSESVIPAPVASDELEAYVRRAAQRCGIDTTRPFPFMIEGQFRDLDAHVVNGYCPMNPDADHGSDKNQPFRCGGRSGRGKLMGLCAENSAGQLTHHGSSLHIHVLMETSPALVAHVERVALAPDAKLRLPAR
ncbi:MAG: hypothetical protein HZB38_05070 [Planctomycetes bacterium]|nr:hypothetical protein [Planctomycetota bacterium]